MNRMTFREFLIDDLTQRKSKNPAYSLRAYAQALGISPGFLTQVLNGRRNLSLSTARLIAEKSGWPQSRRRLFLKLVSLIGGSDVQAVRISYRDIVSEHGTKIAEQVIKESIYMAFLEGTLLSQSTIDPSWWAQTYGVSEAKTARCLSTLCKLRLIVEDGGRFKKTAAHFVFTDVPERIRSHIAMRDANWVSHQIKAKGSDEVMFVRSHVAANPALLAKAHAAMLEAFFNTIGTLRQGECSELYLMSMSLAKVAGIELPSVLASWEPVAKADYAAHRGGKRQKPS